MKFYSNESGAPVPENMRPKPGTVGRAIFNMLEHEMLRVVEMPSFISYRIDTFGMAATPVMVELRDANYKYVGLVNFGLPNMITLDSTAHDTLRETSGLPYGIGLRGRVFIPEDVFTPAIADRDHEFFGESAFISINDTVVRAAYQSLGLSRDKFPNPHMIYADGGPKFTYDFNFKGETRTQLVLFFELIWPVSEEHFNQELKIYETLAAGGKLVMVREELEPKDAEPNDEAMKAAEEALSKFKSFGKSAD